MTSGFQYFNQKSTFNLSIILHFWNTMVIVNNHQLNIIRTEMLFFKHCEKWSMHSCQARNTFLESLQEILSNS